MLGQSLREGCGVNTIMFGSLIKGLCTLKQVGLAVKVFAKMPLMGCTPDVIIYSTLIEGLCSIGDSRLGLELCRRMAREEGCCKPNVITYTTLIEGLFRTGVVGWQEKRVVASLTLLLTALLSMAFAKRVRLAWL